MLTAIGDVMRRVYEWGWITTRDGNISMRKRDGKYLYTTPSGWRKTIVHPEHVVRLEVVTDPATGRLVPNVREKQQPSGELWMHWNLQRDTKKLERLSTFMRPVSLRFRAIYVSAKRLRRCLLCPVI